MRIFVVAWLVGSGCMTRHGRFIPIPTIWESSVDVMCGSNAGALERCRVTRSTDDEIEVTRAAEQRRERENAAIRATGEQLARERATARPRACLGAIADPATDATAEQLDAAMIVDGVDAVRTQVMSCSDQSPETGEVNVAVRVSASGCVVDVAIDHAPDRTLGICVATAIERATFAKTVRGGSFHYPFIFRLPVVKRKRGASIGNRERELRFSVAT